MKTLIESCLFTLSVHRLTHRLNPRPHKHALAPQPPSLHTPGQVFGSL